MIAKTILQQLGGGRFAAMTGAHTFVDTGRGLSFRLPNRTINLVTVTLTPMDEYDMTFSRIRAGQVKEVKKYDGVYCDQLQSLFTEATGLYTHL